jgi:hypothetical protein
MATLQALKKQAKAKGVSTAKLRNASSAAEVQALINDLNGKPRKAVAKKAVKKAVARKATRKAVKRAPAAKSTRGKAKRPAAVKADQDGRNLIESVNFNATDGWNARSGSAPDRIIKALKKSRGNRESAYKLLIGDVWDFVGKVKRNGDKRTKQEAQAMLRYRIARTLWDFVIKTGQHDKATNRITYGTGPNASAKTKRKVTKAQTKPKAKATTGKRRGRPPGSKNKPKK